MKKSTKRLGSLKRKTRLGRPSTPSSALNTKQLTPLQKARMAKKAMRAKFIELKANYKQQLQKATEAAYTKAMEDFQRIQSKKITAKQKLLAAVEAKFEKKYQKKLNKKLIKKLKKHRKNRLISTTAFQRHLSGSKRLGKRGRPRKYA